MHASLAGDVPIKYYNFETCEETVIPFVGDDGIISALYDYFVNNKKTDSVPDITESCYNHMLVFAAEKSRTENVVVDIDDYINETDD